MFDPQVLRALLDRHGDTLVRLGEVERLLAATFHGMGEPIRALVLSVASGDTAASPEKKPDVSKTLTEDIARGSTRPISSGRTNQPARILRSKRTALRTPRSGEIANGFVLFLAALLRCGPRKNIIESREEPRERCAMRRRRRLRQTTPRGGNEPASERQG